MIQGKERIRTEMVFDGTNSVNNLGQRKLLASEDIGHSEFRQQPDCARSMEPSDEGHADIRGVSGKRSKLSEYFVKDSQASSSSALARKLGSV